MCFQSLFTSQWTFQSLFTSPLTFQSLFTSPLTIQSLIRSQQIFQSLFTVTSDHPELRHITADQPESCHVLSATSRYPRSVLQYPRLASSMEDPPLLSVRAAGIPKPAPIPSSPYVPELISLFEALPRMGIAFSVCLGCLHHHRISKGGGAHCGIFRGGG